MKREEMKNSQIEMAKKRYNEIEIPAELQTLVQREIHKADQKRIRRRMARRRIQRTAAAAAAAVVVFTAALNTSTAFAESAGKLPIIGTVARILTFRSYETEEEEIKISVEIPTIEMISEDFQGLEQSINEEILALCQEYADQAMERAKEYRQAFLDTGGTQEEWAAHEIQIRVWYEVKSQTQRYLSFVVMGSENWSSAYRQAQYYNIDLENGSLITLEDILGDDYKEQADAVIQQQMEEREAAGAVFFDDFAGIDEHTSFYLNSDGNPVIVFPAYEIAPGSQGTQEFVIDVNAPQEQETQAETSQETQGEEAGGYQDNFDVDSQTAAAFARQIQEAVAQKDLNKLADMTSFPVYVGFPDQGITVASKEEFLALGADRIFTKEWMDSVAAADVDALTPSMAGFVLSDGSGANLIFSVRDGALTVVGMNY